MQTHWPTKVSKRNTPSNPLHKEQTTSPDPKDKQDIYRIQSRENDTKVARPDAKVARQNFLKAPSSEAMAKAGDIQPLFEKKVSRGQLIHLMP